MYFVGCFLYPSKNSRAVASAAKRRKKTKQSDLLSFRPGLIPVPNLKKIHEDLIHILFQTESSGSSQNRHRKVKGHDLKRDVCPQEMPQTVKRSVKRHTHTQPEGIMGKVTLRDGVGFLQTWHVRVLVNGGPGWEWFESKHRQVSVYSSSLCWPPGDRSHIYIHTNTLTYTNTRGFLSFTCPLVEHELNKLSASF